MMAVISCGAFEEKRRGWPLEGKRKRTECWNRNIRRSFRIYLTKTDKYSGIKWAREEDACMR